MTRPVRKLVCERRIVLVVGFEEFGWRHGDPVAQRLIVSLRAMVAQVCGLEPGEYIHTFGDAHIYSNHMDQVEEQLSRTPRPLPRLSLNPEAKDLFAFEYDDITLEGYDPHPRIAAPVAV